MRKGPSQSGPPIPDNPDQSEKKQSNFCNWCGAPIWSGKYCSEKCEKAAGVSEVPTRREERTKEKFRPRFQAMLLSWAGIFLVAMIVNEWRMHLPVAVHALLTIPVNVAVAPAACWTVQYFILGAAPRQTLLADLPFRGCQICCGRMCFSHGASRGQV